MYNLLKRLIKKNSLGEELHPRQFGKIGNVAKIAKIRKIEEKK